MKIVHLHQLEKQKVNRDSADVGSVLIEIGNSIVV